MGIEFRLGRTDHKVVEQFLDDEPLGVDAIYVDAPNTGIQSSVIDMARRRGVHVLIEPLTERLVEPGFDPRGLDYSNGYPIETAKLKSLKRKAELVERVVGLQLEACTILVPPHFYVDGDESARLSVDLAGLTVQEFRSSKKMVRPILTASRVFLAKGDNAARVAADYRAVGVVSVDLRLSPLGGEDEGPSKVTSALEIATKFSDAGLDVVLGYQPAIGHTALALGIVSGYSAGVGYREHVNHVAAMGQQRKPALPGAKRFGSSAGVFLPAAGVTVPKWVAKSLFAELSIRTKLGCSVGACASEIDHPVKDPRTHYLHSRANLVEELNKYPAAWRTTHEQDRLKRAKELRTSINQNYLPNIRKSEKRKLGDLGIRTLESLATIVERHIDQAKSA
jgi:hypothetical protein